MLKMRILNGYYQIFIIVTALVAAFMLLANTAPHAEASSQVTISVISDDLSGKQISGVWTVLRYTNGTTIAQGYTPVSFQAVLGPAYVVHVGNYQTTVFNHWMDGNTSSYYTFTPSQNANLTAYFSTSGPAPTVPSAPQGLQASGGNTQILLSWTAPSNGGSAITGYKIYRSTVSGAESLLTTNGNLTSYDDSSVTGGQTYFYKVSAINSAGESLRSSEASASTKAASPSSVTINSNQSNSGVLSASPYQMTISNVNAGSANNNLLVVGVAANSAGVSSITFGGAPLVRAVTSFTNNDAEIWYLKNPSGSGNVVVTMGGSTSVVAGAYILSGVNETNPIPTVAAIHSTSNSSPSISIITKNPDDLVLDLPSIYGAKTISSPSCVQHWNVNIQNAITGASSSVVVPSPGTATCSWTASGGGDLWDDVAVEVEASGSSSTPPTVPSSPTGLSATAVSSSQVNLSWTAPSNNGGSPIAGYEIERSANGGSTWSAIASNTGSTGTTYSDKGLAASTTYIYRVSAINSAGTSSPSGTAAATTQNATTAPDAPAGLAATGGNAQVTLSWSTPSSNGGSPITNYKIYRSTSTGTETPLATIGNANSYTDTGLTNGIRYYYKVTAVNSVGESAQSGEAGATPATVPSSPTGLGASAASSSQVNLSWIPPSSNGGSPITGYEIERAQGDISSGGFTNSSGTLYFSYANKTSFNDTGLASSTTYNYTVFAKNSVGPSAHSSTASATTHAPQPQPGSPSSLSTSTISYSKIGLSWATPTYTGTSPIIGYEIYRSDDNGKTWDIVVYNTGSPSTSYTDTGLRQSTTYLYMVSAINSKGISQSSNTTSATTQVAPSGQPAVTTGIREPLYCAPYGTNPAHCTMGSSTDCSIYPNDFCWQPIINAHLAHPHVPFFVIVNPDSGPCHTSNNPCDYSSDYANGIGNLTQNGIVVLGYVGTHYSNSTFSSTCCTLADVEQNVTQWASMYRSHGLQGIAFDEMSNNLGPDDGNLTFYQNLGTYARSLGFTYVFGNPGTATIPQYIYGNASNVFSIYEGSGQPNSTRLTGGDIIGTALSFDRKNFAFASFCQATLPGPSVVGNQSNFVGFMYYTDVGGSCTPSDTDPWDRISSYLSSLASDLDRPASTITIDTVDLEGRPILGYPVEVSQNGTDVPSGYSSLSYLGTVGATYTFTPEGYNKCSFDHWNDNLSDKAARAVRVTQANDQLTAVFSGPGCP